VVAASSSGVFCAGILVYGFALLLGPISREFGWSRQSVSTRRLTGWLVDRFRGTTVSSVLLLTATAGIALLAGSRSFEAVLAAVVLIGFGLGGELDITPFLLTRYFGLRAVSTLYGVAWTTMGLAGAIGPFLMGTAFDRTGSYDGLLAWLAIGTLTAAALMLTLPVHTLRTSKQPVSAALR
jgi:cyanate permease